MSDPWVLIAKWGRRGKKMSHQVKGHYVTEALAEEAQLKLWKSKTGDSPYGERYLDIESKEYVLKMAGNQQDMLTRWSVGIAENLESTASSGPVKTRRPVKEVLNDDSEKNGKIFVEDDLQDEPRWGDPSDLYRHEPDDEVMICVSNCGIEDSFDIGIEYIVEKHETNNLLLYVYDKMGKKVVCFMARFVTPAEWEKRNGR
jgi:predicted DNA-binding WGR domain protein